MLGEEPTSVPGLIQNEWEIRESCLAGGRFNLNESLAVDRTPRTNSGGATGGAPHSSRSRCRCAPPTGRVPSPTTKRSSGR